MCERHRRVSFSEARGAGLLVGLAVLELLVGCWQRESASRGATVASPRDTAPAVQAAAPERVPDFVAHGTEPFWGVRVGPEGVLYRTPDDTSGLLFAIEAWRRSGDTLTFESARTGEEPRTLVLRLTPGSCNNGMSMTDYPWNAVVHLDGVTLSGCAVRR